MPRRRATTSVRRLLTPVLLVPLLAAGGAATASSPATAAPVPDAPVVQVEVVSGRADLVTGGDALVQVTLPPGTDPSTVAVTATGTGDGRDVTGAFAERDGVLLGLVTGLDLGENVLTAALPDGTGARLTVTNAPIGGPVFSGPQIQPWACTTGAEDDQCNRPPTVEYLYMPQDGGGLQPYDTENAPSDVAMTTTEDDNEVPFVVRSETGVSMRDEYRIAALADPAQPVDPTQRYAGNNGKLVLTHGQSCDTSYEMGEAPDVLLEDALSQGFAVASHALDHAGHNCNMVTQAESLIVTKELVAERIGPLRYTIGTGCSGGSLVQQQVSNAYPGVYQGILPQCSFTDAWSSAQQYIDYVGLRAYLESPAAGARGITPAQWPVIYGHPNPANAISFTEVIPNSGEPTRDCPGVPEEDVYDEDTNPDGVRCTFQDYMVNVFGEDENGMARRPIGNTGVMYGLSGLQDGTLMPSQFVGLNADVGGFDLDFNPIPERTAADPLAQDRVYRSGAVNTGAHLNDVAILDFGGPEPGAFHDVYRKYSMRDRLIREHGTADNQVFWEGQTPLLGDPSFVDDGIRKMSEWLAAVEADTRQVPLSQKIIDAKEPAGVAERCVAADGTDAPLALCDGTVDATIYSSPRIEAGGGPDAVGYADDRLECELMPLEEADFGGGATFADTFSEAEQETLRATFPTGVCDYSKPGIGFQDATTWLTYQNADGSVVFGGTPMGAPPVSVPFGPGVDVCAAAPAASVSDREQAREVHRPNVDCVLFHGIASGTSRTTYSPLAEVTRGQMASFLVQALEAAGADDALPAGSGADAFDDIAGNVHRESINRIAAAGITTGAGDRRYNPGGIVSRAEMASFLVRTARFATGAPYDATSKHFSDTAGSVHEDAIDGGYEGGLFVGTAAPVEGTPRSGAFAPSTTVVRDQMASFLVALFRQAVHE